MTTPKSALLLVGSPRRDKGNSHSLGIYLLERLQAKGLATKTLQIYTQLKSDDGIQEMLRAIQEHDIILIAAPLYVDSLPAPVTKALEIIYEDRKTKKDEKKRSLLAIVNCGFPESYHNKIAIDIYRRFACKSGLDWAGGLSLGGGEALGRKPLVEVGWLSRNVRKSLEITAECLAEGKTVSSQAMELMEKPLIPRWLYIFFATREWKRMARKAGTEKSLGNTPYKKVSSS